MRGGSKFRRLFQLPWKSARQISDDVDTELAFHLEMRALEHQARGLAPDAAREAAKIQFGDLEYTKHYCRELDAGLDRSVRRGEWWDAMRRDAVYAWRITRQSPGFALVAIVTLALGIGANTAIFSVVNGVLLKPLPYAEPARLVRVFSRHPGGRMPVSPADLADWRIHSRSFTALAAVVENPTTLSGDASDAERLTRAAVSPSLFDIVGVQPVLGRTFAPASDIGEPAREALITEELWRRRFAGDGGVIGKSILLDDVPHTVVGIVPAGRAYPSGADVWTPLGLPHELIAQAPARNARFQRVIARLRPGLSVAQADADIAAIARTLAQQHPMANANVTSEVAALHEVTVGDLRAPLLVLLGAVGLVLLIACANVANLLLSRATGRQQEMAIRLALGASRARILGQLVTESVMLALVGGIAGLALATWATARLAILARNRLPRLDEIGVDPTVLLTTLGITLLTGLLFGLAPALAGSRPQLIQSLREGVSRSTTRSGGGLQRSLVVAEVALALMLLAGAGLLIESFVKLRAVDPGFRTDGVLTFDISVRQRRERNAGATESRRQLVATLLERSAALPGVHGNALVSGLPMSGATFVLPFAVDGRQAAAGQQLASELRAVSESYFDILRIPLLRGRAITRDDGPNAPRVVVLSATAAQQFFPNEDPMGKRLSFASDSGSREVVGIVGDVRTFGLAEDAPPQIYFAFRQTPTEDLDIILRTNTPAAQLEPAVRALVRELAPSVPVRHVRALDELVATSVAQPRLYMLLLGLFAGVAALLAAVGIYGVISYAVTQRRRELGIRMALGASMADVIRLVLRDGLLLTAIGIAGGAAGAFWATRLLTGLLHGVSATDPLAFAGGVLVLSVVALAACVVPAFRASRVDPAIAMRVE